MSFTIEHFFGDLKELIINPKSAARKLIDCPYDPIFVIAFFIIGLSMGIKKFIASNAILEIISNTYQGGSETMSVVQLGQRDAGFVTAFMLPFLLIAAWYIAAAAINFFAEKAGGYNGSFSDIKTVLGHLGIVYMFFEIIVFLLFVLQKTFHLEIIGILITLLYIVFFIWLMFAGTFCVEAIYGMPMSYAGIVFIGVMIALIGFYYIMIEWVFEKFIMTEILKKKYEI